MRVRRTPAGPASRATRASAATLVATALLLACRGAPPEVGPEVPGGGGGDVTTFTQIRTLILEPRCATSACHGGPSPVAPPRLDGEEAWDAIVDVPALDASLVLVAPGDPDESYLLYTLTGETAAVGGATVQMPVNDLPLDESEIEAIRAWIAAGALND